MITKSAEMEARALDGVVELMALAARTAPKAKGVDNLVVVAVRAKAKDELAAEMRRILKEDGGLPHFERDAGNVDKSGVVLLLGQRVKPLGPKPCGYCGYKDCEENIKNSGLCAMSIGDLGIAIGSAVSVAAAHHVDNRVMFSAVIDRTALIRSAEVSDRFCVTTASSSTTRKGTFGALIRS